MDSRHLGKITKQWGYSLRPVALTEVPETSKDWSIIGRGGVNQEPGSLPEKKCVTTGHWSTVVICIHDFNDIQGSTCDH